MTNSNAVNYYPQCFVFIFIFGIIFRVAIVSNEQGETSKLLTGFSSGDKSAFEKLFHAYYSDTCRYIYRVIQDNDTVEEIVQSTFVHLWEKREFIATDINFKSYLFRAAYNHALNYIKHRKVVSNYVSKKQDRIAITQQDYVSYQKDFELEQAISDAVNELPPQCQKVFRLSREEGMKYHEIADELSISKKTVEVHMGKALKLLRVSLKEYLMFFLPLVVLL